MVLDDFGKLAIVRVTDQINAYNEQVSKSKSTGSFEDFKAYFLDNDESLQTFNAEIQKIQDYLTDLMVRREEAVADKIQPAYDEAVKQSGVDPVALDEALKVIKSAQKFLQSQYGDDILKEIPEVERRKSATSNSGGGTQRRIRGWNIWVDGVLATLKDKDGNPRSTFTAAAKVLDADVSDLQKAFFDAAGSNDPKADAFPTLVEFAFGESKVRAMKQGDSDEESSEGEE